MKTTSDKDYEIISDIIKDIEVINESDYRVIAYSKKHNLIYHQWWDKGIDIDDDIFRSESLLLFEILQEYRPTYFLVNDKKRKVSISTDLNEFLVVNFQPIYAHPSMKKVALISNEELGIQSQAESTMEDIDSEPKTNQAEFAFFIDVTQSIKWLGI